MGTLIESTFVTLDGVIERPERWSPPYWDDEHLSYASERLADADALLLGRVTHDAFAGSWPERSGDPFTDRINGMPKYVASRSKREMTWNASVIDGDVAREVAALKKDRNLLKYGTGSFSRTLLEHGLVDQYHLWVFPVVAGTGARLFDGVDVVTHLKLVSTRTLRSGIVIGVYEPK